jgi:hypothetical protein
VARWASVVTPAKRVAVVITNRLVGVKAGIRTHRSGMSQGLKIQGIDDPTTNVQGYPQSRQIAKLFLSLRNWDSPTSSPAAECGGGAHLLAGEGVGSTNSDEGTYTVVLFIYMYFVGIPFSGTIHPGILLELIIQSFTHYTKSVSSLCLKNGRTCIQESRSILLSPPYCEPERRGG